MMKQKTNVQLADEVADEAAIVSSDNDKSAFAGLAATLAEIRKLKGVLGYILKNDTSAIVDLPEQDKICEYALFTSKIVEASNVMVEQFNLSELESVLVEGKSMKVLCISVAENKISVFMEKTATHAWIIKRILL